MAKLESPNDLRDYCLRKLGSPVINIEVDQTQIDDRIDDTLQLFIQRHFDGVEEVWLKQTISESEAIAGEKKLPSSIVAVTGLIPLTSSVAEPWADIKVQFKLQNIVDFTAPDMVNYALTLQHVNLINQMLSPVRTFNFNAKTHKLKLLGDLVAGNFFIVSAYKAIDPEMYTDVYNDEWVKKYCTAQIKKQWGSNLKKFKNIQMPGGVEFDGQQIFDEADGEIEKLVEEFSLTYELPVDMMIG